MFARSRAMFVQVLMLSLAASYSFGQQSATPRPPQAGAEATLRPTYVLGPNDQILIRATGVEDLGTTPYRVDDNGEITLPLIGKVRASGLSVEQLEADLTRRLAEFVVNPQVNITIVQFRSEPVFIIGAFARPGIHPLQGRRTLLDTLIGLGGLQPNASRRIRVSRRLDQGKIPLATARENPGDGVSTVEIHLGKLMETINPEEDILLQPYDVIAAQKAEMIYVTGEVARPGTFEVGDGESTSVIRVLTLAGGLTPSANSKEVKILRPVMGTRRRAEIRVNLQSVFNGRENDFPLLPDDVLLVSKSKSRLAAVSRTTLLVAPAAATAVLVSLLRR